MRRDNNAESIEIKIARLDLIAATIVTIGDGLATYSAALTLQLLENAEKENDTRSSVQAKLENTQAQLDYYINELIQIRNTIV